MKRQARPVSADPPSANDLQQAALRHLARFSTTQAGLSRVLERRIDRWLRAAPDREDAEPKARAARALIAAIVAGFVASGAVSDSQFAADRARLLTRAGKSRRAAQAWLAQRGVAADLVHGALAEDKDFEAALIFARRKRLGPWRRVPPGPEQLLRELGSLARAGFAQPVARRALAFSLDEAEAAIVAFRNGLD